MNSMRHRAGAASALLLLSTWLAGCGDHRSALAPQIANSSGAPRLAVTAARVAPVHAGMSRWRVTWRVTVGAADHFVVSRAPRSTEVLDDSWTSTRETFAYVEAPAFTAGMTPERGSRSAAVNFLVRAVDGAGRLSPLGGISIVNDNLAPEVWITQPVPSDRGRNYVPPNLEINWVGLDPDGVSSTQPVTYKWTLLTQNSEVPFQVALQNPDSVRRYFEPHGYASWDSTGGVNYTAPSIKYNNLVIGQDYMFVVVARDAQGAWTQVFTQNTNMLNMRVTSMFSGGPLLTIYNEFFFYQYISPSYSLDPQYQILIEVPSGEPIHFDWYGQPAAGASVFGYRWALDIVDITDNTPRSNEATDLAHWSQWSSTGGATVGPLGPNEEHTLYIEAQDTNGLRSLAVVRIHSVGASLENDLLVVDDTRFPLDQKSPGAACMNPPVGRWPMAAELDTFLFAHGNVPWKCYPAGTFSPPGLFSGYRHDTLGTRSRMTGTIPLSMLAHYQHVIWLTDASGALNTSAPTNVSSSITSLRYMTTPGRTNSLASYVAAGGQLWVAGGGISLASMLPYDRLNNNTTQPAPGVTFSNLNNELIPGRFPYSIGGWQSEIKATLAQATVSRNLGRFTGRGSLYEFLPPAMRARTAASDPYPPNRTVNPGNFYYTNFSLEYLSQANNVIEDVDPSPAVQLESVVDTLYAATGATLVPHAFNDLNVCMTQYRHAGGNPVLYTGFTLWDFQRADSKGLVDFVLQNQWGLIPTAANAKRPALHAWQPGRTR